MHEWRAGRSVRGACVRAAESVRGVAQYPSAAVGYSIRYSPRIVYNHRARPRPLASPAVHLSARQKRALRQANRPFRQRTFGRPLQAVELERVGNNTIQD